MIMTRIHERRFKMLRDFLSLRLVSESVFIAGGSLQTLVNKDIAINDYDLFFTDKTVAAMVKKRLDFMGADLIFECPAGDLSTYKLDDMKIQLITKFYYKNMEQLISTFDFRASMWAYDGKQLCVTRGAVKDTLKKQVNLNAVTFPVATLNRMIKYAARKGFYVTPQTVDLFVRTVNQSEYDEDEMVLYVD